MFAHQRRRRKKEKKSTPQAKARTPATAGKRRLAQPPVQEKIKEGAGSARAYKKKEKKAASAKFRLYFHCAHLGSLKCSGEFHFSFHVPPGLQARLGRAFF